VITQIFPSFEAALAACGAGYHDAALADVIAYKTSLPVDVRRILPEQAVNAIVAVGIAAAATDSAQLHVLDFGGGCGVHYFTCVDRFRMPLKWVIVETATMAQRGKALAQRRFEVFTDVASAADHIGRVDLIFISSALSYVPDPLATLKALLSLRPRHFALARFPVWGGPQTVGLQTSLLSQNGIGPMPPNIPDRPITYPVTFANFDEVMRMFGAYDLISVTESPSASYVVRNVNVSGITLIFRAKDGTAAA
jgi:putative methyltransferase (TIGR04325 family)